MQLKRKNCKKGGTNGLRPEKKRGQIIGSVAMAIASTNKEKKSYLLLETNCHGSS